MSDSLGDISCLSTSLGRAGIRTWVVGTIGAGIGYGIVCIIGFQCFFFLSRSMLSGKEQRMRNTFLMLYVVAMIVLTTIAIAANAVATWKGIIGTTCFQLKGMDPFNALGRVASVSFVMTNWAADGMLLWRLVAIYKDCERVMYRYVARSLLTLLFCYIFAEGIVLIARVDSNFTLTSYFDPISYVAVSMSLNVIMTAMIVGRLAYLRHISNSLRRGEGEFIISVISMLLESAALIVLVDLLYLIPYMSSSPVVIIPLQCIIYVQAIAPLMIIQRVVLKKAWSRADSPKAEKELYET